MKRLICSLFLLLPAVCAFSQIWEPVKWQLSFNESSGLVFTASVEPGWHIYGLEEQPGGPNPTVFSFEKVLGAQLVGGVMSAAPSITAYDKVFGMEMVHFDGNPSFIQKFKLTSDVPFMAEGHIDYSACNQKRCVSRTEEFSYPPNILPLSSASDDSWRPVTGELKTFGGQSDSKTTWHRVFLLSFIGGLLALVMPCIWPIIPITVSFFLKSSQHNHKRAIAKALLYGLSILVIYLVLGLFFTLVFGASALNNLATNAFANLIFFTLLVLFALSFFGLFEFRLPASWVNKISGKSASATGVLSIFFMAFTLVLVSFSCTGPIIGTLLVQLSASDEILYPAIGMFGFGLALAIPFTLFAFFPSLLSKLPKSGGWLGTLKIVLGFLELALALKFLSVADLAYHWNILSRETFLIIWILIFASLGFYILGIIKFPHEEKKGRPTIYRLFFAIITFSFVSYMVPGLWGAPLKHISAFLPPLSTQKLNLYGGMVKPKFYDYDEGMLYARQNNKPVLLDFTGYGCVNCRKMEAAVLSDLRVKEIIDNEYVLIALHVDDRGKLPQIIEKEEYGKKIKLRTVGDKWSYLQRHKFGANAQPYYILLDGAARPIAPWRAFDEDIKGFIKYLKDGIKTYRQH